MTARNSKSYLMSDLEVTLDNNEEYIGSTVWKELEKTFEKLDDEAKELEDELEEANERVKELEEELETLKNEK